jgi:hypothetical protein
VYSSIDDAVRDLRKRGRQIFDKIPYHLRQVGEWLEVQKDEETIAAGRKALAHPNIPEEVYATHFRRTRLASEDIVALAKKAAEPS